MMNITPTNGGYIHRFSATSAQTVASAPTAIGSVGNDSKFTDEIINRHIDGDDDGDIARVVTESFDSSPNDNIVINEIPITELLSTCIDACRRGCEVIRNVRHKLVQTSNVVGSDSEYFCCSAVKYKISNDPRSALTVADEASQQVITECLKSCWGKEINSGLIKIVGEEDDGDDISSENNVSLRERMAHFDKYNTPRPDLEPIQRDIILPSSDSTILDGSDSSNGKRNQLIIFIDPMDGTREFVENRIENVQCLIGITLNGKPIAGAVGMPMLHEKKIEVAYGIDWPTDSEQEAPTTTSPPSLSGVKYFNSINPLVKQRLTAAKSMGNYVDGDDDVEKLVVLSGDSKKPVLKSAMQCLEKDILGSYGESPPPPIRKIIAGGCGNKMLFVQRRFQVLSERIRHNEASIIGSISLAPPGSSSWDTAGPTALLLAADPNAIVTDMVGRPLIYDGEHLSNDCGVVVSAGFVATRIHREMCEKLRRDEAFCKLLGVVRSDAEII